MSHPVLGRVQHRTEPSSVPSLSRIVILLLSGCLLIPRGVEFQLGTIMINSSRILLSIFGIVVLSQWASGRIRIPWSWADWLMSTHVFIIVVAALYHEGLNEGLEIATGQTVLDMGVAYFLARAVIRDIPCYRYFVRITLFIVLISAIIGLSEMLTGYNVVRAIYHAFFPKVLYVHLGIQRLGLWRAYALFGTDILLGVFCMVAFALAWHVEPSALRMGRAFKKFCLLMCLVGVFSSLSSGPWLGLAVCAACLAYQRIMRGVQGRWAILFSVLGAMWLFLSVASNRGPIRIIICDLTLDPVTGYYRYDLWRCIWALMRDYWALGWGWKVDWPRAVEWINLPSIDSLYGVLLVQAGVFSVITLIGFLAYSLRRAYQYTNKDGEAANESSGWILAMVCLFLVATTVHIFGNLTFWTCFLFGAGQIFVGRPNSRPSVGKTLRGV